MSTRAVIVLVLVASALSAAVSFSLAAGALHEGPAGRQGATGPPGPPGRSGDTTLDYEDIQQNLDPDPSDVESKVDELAEKLDNLCSDLSLSDAVSSDITSC